LIDLDASSSELGFSEVPVSTPALVYDDGRWIRSFFLSKMMMMMSFSFFLSFLFFARQSNEKKVLQLQSKEKKVLQLQSNGNKVLQLLLVSSLKVLPMHR
jgi:hypothetical protein